ncbi:MAG TPA: protein kinase [Gemmatimonadales bacterium]|nr:protein kinase [Gemmatimonadales bacterium]
MIGRTLGQYQILERLGEGGMGTVYRAHDPRLERSLAIKVLRADRVADEERRKRFVREARSASALNHPNIITIYDIGQAEGADFIAMEWVQGRTLDQLIGTQGLPVPEALRYAVQMADALARAHAAGIIHRDLKPANIMVTDDGRVKILDFGLAKLVERSESQPASQAFDTEAGVILGTVSYMSPEQAEGRPLDARSDIFSFGAVLYEMLTGKCAFPGNTPTAALAAVLMREPKPLREIVPAIPTDVARIVTCCLAKEPDRRFQHMADVTIELQAVLEARVVPRPAEVPSIAVLPFADLSPQRDQENFCDGITEELITALSNVEGLRVVSRTSSFRFKGKLQDIREIGAELNVRMILEGSVRRAGALQRVTVQLINVGDGYHLWSERYDRDVQDVFVIQDEIAQAVAETLKTRLLGQLTIRAVAARDNALNFHHAMRLNPLPRPDALRAGSLHTPSDATPAA